MWPNLHIVVTIASQWPKWMTLRVVLIRRFLGLHQHEKHYLRFFHFFSGYFSFVTVLFWAYSISSRHNTGSLGFPRVLFCKRNVACFSLIRSDCNMPYTRVTYNKPRDLKPHVFKMAAIWANKKNCSKFLFVDRIKIFVDIGYSMYKESIENIKKCTNFAVSFPLIISSKVAIYKF